MIRERLIAWYKWEPVPADKVRRAAWNEEFNNILRDLKEKEAPRKRKSWDMDARGNKITEGEYFVTEEGTTCGFQQRIIKQDGELCMWTPVFGCTPLIVPLKDSRMELMFWPMI